MKILLVTGTEEADRTYEKYKKIISSFMRFLFILDDE